MLLTGMPRRIDEYTYGLPLAAMSVSYAKRWTETGPLTELSEL
jgi:hypothetical protein